MAQSAMKAMCMDFGLFMGRMVTGRVIKVNMRKEKSVSGLQVVIRSRGATFDNGETEAIVCSFSPICEGLCNYRNDSYRFPV